MRDRGAEMRQEAAPFRHEWTRRRWMWLYERACVRGACISAGAS